EPGNFVTRRARECTRREILDELHYQLLNARGPDGAPILEEHGCFGVHIDDDLVFAAEGPQNDARLLVHPPGLWSSRPRADVGLGNLFSASDYVRTHIDLATMEGANEAARHAVNTILELDDSSAAPCMTESQLDRAEPQWLKEIKRADDRLY